VISELLLLLSYTYSACGNSLRAAQGETMHMHTTQNPYFKHLSPRRTQRLHCQGASSRPVLFVVNTIPIMRHMSYMAYVGLARTIHIYVCTVYIRCFRQRNHHTYGHIRCAYTVLANPRQMWCAMLSCQASQARGYIALLQAVRYSLSERWRSCSSCQVAACKSNNPSCSLQEQQAMQEQQTKLQLARATSQVAACNSKITCTNAAMQYACYNRVAGRLRIVCGV